MLRLSCPLVWAEQMIRQAVRGEGGWHWQATVNLLDTGVLELLMLPPKPSMQQDGRSTVPVHLHLVNELPTDPPRDVEQHVRLWLTHDGHWWGQYQPLSVEWLHRPPLPITELWLPGPGLQSLRSGDLPLHFAARHLWRMNTSLGWRLAAATLRDNDGPGSRSAGALGWEAVESLRACRFGLACTGRQGHAVATILATYQPRELALFDKDVIEPGNLDAGLAFAESRFAEQPVTKVDALATLLRRAAPTTLVSTYALNLQHHRTLQALAECDIIISASDREVPRLASALVAAAHHRIHLDIGSLITRDPHERVVLGADIRLTVPGDRDLCCLGGFRRA